MDFNEFTYSDYILLSFLAPENYTEELLKPEVVARIKYVSSSEHRLDETLRPKDKDVPQASFRKLNID